MNEQRCTRLIIGTLLLSLGMIVLMAGSGISATFGDIEGRVVDGSTGEPLDGATISLETRGLRRETVTDSLGTYQFDNVVTGQYRMAVTADGFDSLVVGHLPIVASLTTYRFHPMTKSGGDGLQQSQPIGSVEGATVYSMEDIVRLPVRSFADVLLLQPTVTESRSNAIQLHEIQTAHEPQNAPQLHVLGGRLWDHGYSINGVNFTEPISRSYTASVSPHAIDQLVFRSGPNSVASSNGNAGMIEVLTRPGGEQYSGMVEAVTDNTVGSGYDQNYYTARLSGPIPLLDKGLFMGTVERRWMRDRNPSPKAKEVLPSGPDQLPNNWQSEWSYHGRADYDFTDDLSVTLTGDKSSVEWSEYRHAYLFNIAHTPRFKDDNLGLRARLAYHVNDNVSVSLGGTYRETERIQGDGVVFDDYEAYERKYIWPDGKVVDVANPGLDGFYLFYSSDEPLWIRHTSGDSVQISYDHYFENFQHYKSSTVGLKGEVNAQLGSFNKVSVGFEYRRHTLRYFENLDATMGHTDKRVIRYGYDSLGRESDNEGWRHETKHPNYLAFHVQDRFSYRGLALAAGLRWEQFDHKDYLFYNYTNPYAQGDPSRLDQDDLVRTSSFSRISPNVRASYRFLDRVRVHAGIDISHRLPPLRQVYNDWRFFEARAGVSSIYTFPYAGIESVRSRQFDAGFTIRASDQMTVGFVAFWRRSTDETGTAMVETDPFAISPFPIYANGLESEAKGFTIRVVSLMRSALRTSLAYTWSKAEGAIESQWYVDYHHGDLNHDRRHRFIGSIILDLGRTMGPRIGGIYPLKGLNVNLTARVSSGRPYAPVLCYAAAIEAVSRPAFTGPINSERSDWTSTIDIRAERKITIGGMSFVPFLWIKNLLDTENIADVWGATGEPDNTGYLDTEPGRNTIEQWPEFEPKYRLKEANPQNYGPPQQVFFGIRAEF